MLQVYGEYLTTLVRAGCVRHARGLAVGGVVYDNLSYFCVSAAVLRERVVYGRGVEYGDNRGGVTYRRPAGHRRDASGVDVSVYFGGFWDIRSMLAVGQRLPHLQTQLEDAVSIRKSLSNEVEKDCDGAQR